MIIVIEGVDAAGKYTQSTKLAEAMRGQRFAFPNYESPTGSIIFAHLNKWWKCQPDGERVWSEADMRHLDARVFQLLQTVNRIESLPHINACIARGQHVIFDRYWQSGYVYGSLDGLETEWLHLVQERLMPQAHVNILIDVPVECSFQRRPERRDRYETNREFLERVRSKYLELWGSMEAYSLFDYVMKSRPGWYIVQGTGTVDEVHAAIRNIIEYHTHADGMF
jgi:thymidylate kinase